MSSLTSGIGGGIFGGSSAPKTETAGVTTEGLLTAAKADQTAQNVVTGDVAGGCPRFTIQSRDSQVTIYEMGKVGDELAVLHRGEITKTARECHLDGNRLSIKYGFSGRVLLGPRGKGGTVLLPLTVYVTDAKRERIVQDPVRVEVPVAVDKPIGYFSTVHDIAVNLPEGTRPGEFEIVVGFDRNIPGAG